MTTPDPDDDMEIEVVAAPPRRPRTPNPAVDEVIQSGEIQALPRSLIVRSTANPPLHDERREDLARGSQPGTMQAKPARSRFGRISFLIAALAPAIAALVLRVAEPPKQVAVAPKPTEVEALAKVIASTFETQAHAAQQRVETIATSTMLRAAIQTDAATLADMAKDQDIVFALAKGERLQILQGDTSMLVMPKDAAPIGPVTATRLEQINGELQIVVAAPIAKQGGGTAGTVELALPVELAPAKAQPLTQVSKVQLAGMKAPIALGGAPATAQGTPVAIPVVTPLAQGLSITAVLATPVIAAQDNVMLYARYACAGLATLFLLLYVISVIVRR
ncbi:MAG: hypothetical protein QM831_45805 [Kofleriaceae bacterium]